jgi:cysteine-rich repeat protein
MRTVVWLFGAAILLILSASHAAAQECPDVTGCWAGEYTGDSSGTMELTLVQTGSLLSGSETVQDVNFGTQTGDVSGTIACDSLTFAFPFAETSGLVTGDCMAGTWTSTFAGNGTWQGCRVGCVCGNGVVQPGETCDDGNTLPGDCCAADCSTDPAGTACGMPPLSGACDADGHCVAIPTLGQWGVALLSMLMLAAVVRRRGSEVAGGGR